MLGDEFYRNRLSVQGRRFYDAMIYKCRKGDYSKDTPVTITDWEHMREDARDAHQALRDDHPEYFWIGRGGNIDWSGTKWVIRCPCLYTGEMIQMIQIVLQHEIKELTKGLEYLSGECRQRTIYERISNKYKRKDNHQEWDHNVVGPLLYSEGVCEGLNAILVLCFRKVGIMCRRIYGEDINKRKHCWCKVYHEGSEGVTGLHCDVTWEMPNRVGNSIPLQYFNLTDQKIGKDHFHFI